MEEIVFIIIPILFIFCLSVVLLSKGRKQTEEQKSKEEWDEIMEHNRKIRKEAGRRIREFGWGDKVWAKRSDYHKWEKGEIVNYDGTYVFLQYFNVKFENGDVKSINYFSIKKI